LENLGNFDARRGEKAEFKADRIRHWVSVGAQVSPTVHNLLVSRKIIEGKKINVLPLKKPIVKEKVEEVKEAPVPEQSSLQDEAPAEIAPEALSEDPAPAAEPVEEVAVETPAEPVPEVTVA